MHRPSPWLSLSFVLVLAPFTPRPAQANDSAMGGHGGSLVPTRESRVAMVSEDIELRYEADDWVVQAHYVFRNESDERVALQMGFPETHCDGEGDCVMAEGDVFENMRTLVRGEQVPRKKGKLSERHAWAPKLGSVWLYDVTFAPREELEIDHTYTTPSGVDVMGSRFTTYITRTGSLWGKPIERATFRVRLPSSVRELHEDTGVPRLKAERPEGDTGPLELTYEARDWTPQQDFHIGFNERVDWYGLQPAGPLKALRCDALFSLYLVAETVDGRAAEGLDLPRDLASLRICRNAVYAQHGRRFQDEALNQYFYGEEGFVADGPAVLAFDPNPNYRDALLTPEDRKVLAMIVARERAVARDQGLPPPDLEAETEGAPALDREEAAPTAASDEADDEARTKSQVAPAEGSAAPAPGCGGCHALAPAPGAAAALGLWLLLGRRPRRRR